MQTGGPSEHVLGLFGLGDSEARPQPGGQGDAWRAAGVVLKPVDDVDAVNHHLDRKVRGGKFASRFSHLSSARLIGQDLQDPLGDVRRIVRAHQKAGDAVCDRFRRSIKRVILSRIAGANFGANEVSPFLDFIVASSCFPDTNSDDCGTAIDDGAGSPRLTQRSRTAISLSGSLPVGGIFNSPLKRMAWMR